MKQIIIEKIESVESAIESVESAIGGLLNQLALKQGFKKPTSEIENQINILETELSNLKTKIADLKNDLSELNSKIKTIVNVVYDVKKEYPDSQFGAWYFDVKGAELVFKNTYSKAVKTAIQYAEKQNSYFVSVKKFVRVASF
jgi:chromosome segregation ATPase